MRRGLNPRLSECKSDALPLRHSPPHMLLIQSLLRCPSVDEFSIYLRETLPPRDRRPSLSHFFCLAIRELPPCETSRMARMGVLGKARVSLLFVQSIFFSLFVRRLALALRRNRFKYFTERSQINWSNIDNAGVQGEVSENRRNMEI